MRIQSIGLFCVALTIFTSCSKKFSDTSSINSQSVSHELTNYKSPFGVFINKSNNHIMPYQDEINLTHDLGVSYARLSISNLQWNDEESRDSFLTAYKAYTEGGQPIQILLTVNWGNDDGGRVPFPGTSPDYKKYITDLTDTLTSSNYVKPALIVLENEENNPVKHVINGYADQSKYINQLKFAIKECHKKGLQISNGGLTDTGIVWVIWDYYQHTLNNPNLANTFLHNCVPDDVIDQLKTNKDIPQSFINIAKYYINTYKGLKLDYVNIHWYEPIKVVYADRDASIDGLDTININPACLQSVFSYFKDPRVVNGIPLICNEAGQVTSSTELPLQITCMMRNLPFVIYFSGDRPDDRSPRRPYGQYALHTTLRSGEPRYVIRATGDAFRDNVAAINANPDSSFCNSVIPQ